jgi:putative transposase
MASRNTIRQYEPDAMYHVYNRGVNKQNIFEDERDYSVFLSFLKYALTPDSELDKHAAIDKDIISIASRFNLRRERFSERIELVSFCLMPNHFHLQLYQYDKEAITGLMRSIATGYAIYFNKRYDRVGSLFQGKYKASRINSDSYWTHISRYIHLNPLDIKKDYKFYPYSSFHHIVDDDETDWLKPQKALEEFEDIYGYKKFVEDYIPYKNDLKDMSDLLANSKELGL